MTIGNPSQPANLNEESRQIWDHNATFWDGKIGDNGNDFHRLLIAPANERLLNLQPGEMDWRNRHSIILTMAHSPIAC